MSSAVLLILFLVVALAVVAVGGLFAVVYLAGRSGRRDQAHREQPGAPTGTHSPAR